MPVTKPVALADWCIEVCAPKASSVIDPFLGSGSTLIAAQARDISCFGCELAPAYIDVAVRRWQSFTGQSAVLESTGATFAATETERVPSTYYVPATLTKAIELLKTHGIKMTEVTSATTAQWPSKRHGTAGTLPR